MTQKRTYIRKINAIGGSLTILLASGIGLLNQSCVSENNEADYEIEEKYTQGVRTYLTETEAGKFKITDEQIVAADSSKAIVTYLDGSVKELSKEQAKELIDKEISTSGERVGQGSGLGSALLYGGMGYFLARTLSPGYGRYRPAYQEQDRNRTGTSASYASSRKYYANDAAYSKASGVTQSMAKSRTFTSRPSSSRGGFFGGRTSSSRGGGFGG